MDSVTIPLADAIYAQALRYTRMFDGKPFAEAILIYLRNGAYRIVSPGEDHYGSYLAISDVASGPGSVTFISWPASDWDDNVAWHSLLFGRDDRRFTQELHLPGDPDRKHQEGFAAAVDLRELGCDAPWHELRDRYDSTFAELADLAESETREG